MALSGEDIIQLKLNEFAIAKQYLSLEVSYKIVAGNV